MEGHASTSSAPIDQRRRNALVAYRAHDMMPRCCSRTTFAGIGGLFEQHRPALRPFWYWQDPPRACRRRDTQHQLPQGRLVRHRVKYIGESARVVREMFGYARDHEPCVIFTLDPALVLAVSTAKLRFRCRTSRGRLEVLKIHAKPVSKSGEIDHDVIVKLSDEDLRNGVTESGMFAIRDDREYITQEDLTKAARKAVQAKEHEAKME
ncbi:hypothetical protein EXIGLDRAFT_782776 [Exidia glandulosa HHB12029]|uniref:Uncharacterized protein n=1 Tax=Exidia glandulosa HHB12029 TaxID=1314781 RepID=A0A166NG56_EXIGL|nr:hypothetical protein EXIGLDRAFT_782776 [Exidia glandulosa HHB12029]